MATWETPLSWSHGESIDVLKFNQMLRDNIAAMPELEAQDAERRAIERLGLRQMLSDIEIRAFVDKYMREFFKNSVR